MADALQKAREAGLDLVEIAPTANPPVCRIMNFGKFIYQQKKKQQDSKKKQKTTQVKEVKFRPNIDDHDYDFKMKNIVKFLAHGDKVKATVQFRGREMARRENGQKVLDRLLEGPRRQGRSPSRARRCSATGSTRSSSPVKHEKGEQARRRARRRRLTPARSRGRRNDHAEAEDPSRRREAVQEDRVRQVQEGQGLQEPHPHQEGAGPEARPRAVDDRVQGATSARVREMLPYA